MTLIIIACCIGAFILGIAFLYGVMKLSILHNNKKKKGRTADSAEDKKKIGTMDIILVIIGVSALAFTVVMIWIFTVHDSVPDTLITCFFAFIGGECGAMALIKTAKERRQERKWQLEDEERNEENGND